MTSWKPIARAALAHRLRDATTAIGDAIAVLGPGDVAPGLSGGKAGLAVCLEYLGRDGDAWLAAAYEDAAEQTLAVDLYRGVLGIAWAAQHLATRGGATVELDAALDESLHTAVEQQP